MWPNGEFGIGKLKTVAVLTGRVEAPSNSLDASSEEYKEWLRRFEEKTGMDAGGVLHPGLGAVAERVALMDATAVAMGLSNVLNSHKPKKRRGALGISTYGKKMLRNGAYMLQRAVGKRNMAMFTATIPRVSDVVERDVSVAWPEIVRVFLQELERELARHGLRTWTVGCTEVQEERMATHGGFPLHLHVVFQGKQGRAWARTPQFYRELWKRILVHYVPELAGESFLSATRVEGIRKDASSYIAKYASKGVKGGVLEMMGEGYRIPTGWTHITGGLKRAIKKSVVYFCDKRATAMLLCVFRAPQVFRWVGEVRIPVLGNEDGDGVRQVLGDRPIAWYGSLLWKFSELVRRGFSPCLDESGDASSPVVDWVKF
jgi:hypothetical protein